MKILVIGSGGREHALVWGIAQSKNVEKIYCAPGNGGIAKLAQCIDIEADDIKGLMDFALREKIDFAVVGPEAPLVAGIVDEFKRAGLKIFGPTKKAAQLEASKGFAKEIMKKYGVPTAQFFICHHMEKVRAAVSRLGLPVVVKADGLAAGKGVVICETLQAAEQAARQMLIDKIFGDSGSTVVVEECLKGEEASILVLTNGRKAIPLASSQDHKRIFDQDRGPNTGGMGAYSPAPVATPKILDFIMKKIISPVIEGMNKEGATYKGILYAGIMITKDGPKVLEFNVRFGDPETQAILARLKSDLMEAMLWTTEDKGQPPALKWDNRSSVCVVVASGGYPGSYEKGKAIMGLEEAAGMKDVVVFHAGTKKSKEGYVTEGGRVLGVTAKGTDLRSAIDKAYRAVSALSFDKIHFRRDIGWRALQKLAS